MDRNEILASVKEAAEGIYGKEAVAQMAADGDGIDRTNWTPEQFTAERKEIIAELKAAQRRIKAINALDDTAEQ